MSKIIIHNMHENVSDATAVQMAAHVMANGFVSGENQYCWLTHWKSLNAIVVSMKTRGNTHTFKVCMDD